MPSDAAERETGPHEWERLERLVRRLLDDHEASQRRAEFAETRVRELEAVLNDVSSGKLDPMKLAERAQELERENRQLESRLTLARDTVQRILARLRFAEEEP